jgi:hypothetical protein
MSEEMWHHVEAKRDDGTHTMFRIRELPPQKRLDRIFVVEMPYPTTELSRLPDATAYRRLSRFEEQWLVPACAQLGWELVGSKTEDGSFFLYMYGASDPDTLRDRLSPFDAALGFYNDHDPEWAEYATLRELLDKAKAMPQSELAVLEEHLGAVPSFDFHTPADMPPVPAGQLPTRARPTPRQKAPAKKKPAKAKVKATAKAKPAPKRKAKAASPKAKATQPAAKRKAKAVSPKAKGRRR